MPKREIKKIDKFQLESYLTTIIDTFQEIPLSKKQINDAIYLYHDCWVSAKKQFPKRIDIDILKVEPVSFFQMLVEPKPTDAIRFTRKELVTKAKTLKKIISEELESSSNITSDSKKRKDALEDAKRRVEESWNKQIQKLERLKKEATDFRTAEIIEKSIDLAISKKNQHLEEFDKAIRTKTFTIDAVLVEEKKSVKEQHDLEKKTVQTAYPYVTFENYVKEIFTRLNYKPIQTEPREKFRPDFIMVDDSKIPPEKIIVECKLYKKSLVPSSAIMQMSNYIAHFNADKGIIVTNLGFSDEAKKISSDSEKLQILTVEELIKRIPRKDRRQVTKEPHFEYKTEVEVIKEQEESGLKTKKQSIEEKYRKALRETDSNTKGKLLEEVVQEIIQLVPNLTVTGSRSNNGIQEIDILVRNHNNNGIWNDFDSIIFIECKNWTSPVGSDEIRNFVGKLRTKHLNIGIFVSVSDITGNRHTGARGQIQLELVQGFKVLVLNAQDIEDIIKCTDVSDKVDEKFVELYT